MSSLEKLRAHRPTKMNPKGFFKRQWPLLAVFVLVFLLQFSQTLIVQLGGLVYLPILGLFAFIGAGLLRRGFNKSTTEADAADGTFDTNWDSLDPKTKTILHCIQFWVYLLFLGIIAAACIK